MTNYREQLEEGGALHKLLIYGRDTDRNAKIQNARQQIFRVGYQPAVLARVACAHIPGSLQ